MAREWRPSTPWVVSIPILADLRIAWRPLYALLKKGIHTRGKYEPAIFSWGVRVVFSALAVYGSRVEEDISLGAHFATELLYVDLTST